MIVTDQIEYVRQIRWEKPEATWGLVPTMGYLHEGHLSLAWVSEAENDYTAVSIYINPTQFAPNEDLSTYPRDLQRDLALLEAEGVDLVFTPSDEVMYPSQFQTHVTVNKVTKKLEGGMRPTHFEGVTTIVTKLLNIVQPTRAYFGQKDFQQTVVIKRLADDLNINTDIVVCPIMREKDGLAMSSRNARLDTESRRIAPSLNAALRVGEELLDRGERHAAEIIARIKDVIDERMAVEYVSVAHPETLEELAIVGDKAVISAAASIGGVRLIDNILWAESNDTL